MGGRRYLGAPDYVERPLLAKVDAKHYMALRKGPPSSTKCRPRILRVRRRGMTIVFYCAEFCVRVALRVHGTTPLQKSAGWFGEAAAARRSRKHRDRHPGAGRRGGRSRRRAAGPWPTRRAARPCPTSPDCCRPPGGWCPVVHCLVQRRADGLGSNHNAKLPPSGPAVGYRARQLRRRNCCPEFGPETTDSAYCDAGTAWGHDGGTDLDAIFAQHRCAGPSSRSGCR